MADIKVSCPRCGQHVMIPDELKGKKVSCPTCNKEFVSLGPKLESAKSNGATQPAQPGSSSVAALLKTPGLAALFLVWAIIATLFAMIRSSALSKELAQANRQLRTGNEAYETLERQNTRLIARIKRLETEQDGTAVQTAETVSSGSRSTYAPENTYEPSDSNDSGDTTAEYHETVARHVPPAPVVATAEPDSNAAPKPEDARPVELVNAITTYRTQTEKIHNEHTANLQDLDTRYTEALAKLRKQMQDEGNLDGVIALDREKTRFAGSGEIASQNVVSAPKTLADLQRAYREAQDRFKTDKAKELADLRQQYSAHLANLEKKFTREGDLERALKVREERKRIDES